MQEYDITPENFGNNLQHLRKSVGMTQQILCNVTGVSYSTLTKIERGAIKAPSIFTIALIAKAIGCSIETLLYDVAADIKKIDLDQKIVKLTDDAKKQPEPTASTNSQDIDMLAKRLFVALTEINALVRMTYGENSQEPPTLYDCYRMLDTPYYGGVS